MNKPLDKMTVREMSEKYTSIYGLPSNNHGYVVLYAALFYNKRIKHLTEEEINAIKIGQNN